MESGGVYTSNEALAARLAALKARLAAGRTDVPGIVPPAAPATGGAPASAPSTSTTHYARGDPSALMSSGGDYHRGPSPIPPHPAGPAPPYSSGYATSAAPTIPRDYGSGMPTSGDPYSRGHPENWTSMYPGANPAPYTAAPSYPAGPMAPQEYGRTPATYDKVTGSVTYNSAPLRPGYQGGMAGATAGGSNSVGSRQNEFLLNVQNNLVNLQSARKVAPSVDIAFLIDCTGSMQKWIDRTKDTVIEILDRLRALYPEAELRTAFVGYRDFEPTDNNLASYVVEQFMPPEHLKTRIAGVVAQGGDDHPEDVIGGLAKIPLLDWRGKARVLIHIADAPPHGRRFHLGKYSDRFADTPDPNGKRPQDMEEQVRLLVKKHVDYYFFKCDASTDIFETEVRENIYRRWFPSKRFEVLSLTSDDKAEFLEKIMTATRSSMLSVGLS